MQTKRPAGLKTREAILEAAKGLFLLQGYHATGMREVAREAGISLGAAYNHFTSKEEILKELLAQNNLYGTIAEGLCRAEGDTVAELLESGFTEVMAGLQGKMDFPLLLFTDILEFQGRHVGELVDGALPTLLGFFQRAYTLGEQRGEIRDIPRVLLARSFIGMIFSSFIIDMMGMITKGNIRIPLQTENREHGMVDILLHGILKELPEQEGA